MKYQDWQRMSKKNKLIPELRFPEFTNDGEWQILNGNELFEPISNKDHNSDLPILAISQELGAVPRELIDYTVIASKESIKSYKVVEVGDFIISLRSFQGGIEYSNYKGICSPAYIILRKKKKLDDIFYKYYFKSTLYIRHLNKNLEGIRDGKMVSYKQFSEILLPYPSIKEQNKIAAYFSSMDALIETSSQKLKTLIDHKKGLMQNLFPQGNSKSPQYRFPMFEKNGEWQYLNGDELFKPISNKKHKSDLPVLAISQEYGAVPREQINYTVIASKQSIAGYKVVEIGDFIISLRSFQGGIEYSNYKGICSPAYIILRKKKKLDDIFYKYYFKSDFYILQLNKNLEGIRDGKMVSYKQFSEIKLPLPSIEEQRKIASSLTSIENLISSQTEKIKQLKKHKKGLMQSLFPNNI